MAENERKERLDLQAVCLLDGMGEQPSCEALPLCAGCGVDRQFHGRVIGRPSIKGAQRQPRQRIPRFGVAPDPERPVRRIELAKPGFALLDRHRRGIGRGHAARDRGVVDRHDRRQIGGSRVANRHDWRICNSFSTASVTRPRFRCPPKQPRVNVSIVCDRRASACRSQQLFWGFPMVFQRKKVASALGLVLGVGGIGDGRRARARPGHSRRCDRLEHPARRGRGRAAGADHHARGDRPHRRADGRRAAAIRVVERERRRDLGHERDRRADEQRGDGVAARPRRPEHAGAAERQAPDGRVRRDPGRLRRQPRLDPVLGDRARRGAEGRRVGRVRQRRDRRRDQLHPAPGLPRRRGDRLLRRSPRAAATAARSRTSPARSAGAISPRTSSTSSSRPTTRRPSRSTRTSATSPTAASTSTRACSACRATRSRRTSRPAASERRASRTARRAIYAIARLSATAASSTRPRRTASNSIPEQETYSLFASGRWQFHPELAALRHGGVHEGRHPLRHPADAAFGPVHLRAERGIRSRRSCCHRRARTIRRRSQLPAASAASR